MFEKSQKILFGLFFQKNHRVVIFAYQIDFFSNSCTAASSVCNAGKTFAGVTYFET